MHAFTQESQIHDAVQKLEDLDAAMKAKEPGSIPSAVETAALFSSICARQPRALQICVRILERAAKQASSSGSTTSDAQVAAVYCQMGHVQILQGSMQFERAMKAFREATRRDPNNATALEGMILCQLYEGAVEDAESQIELLTLMHSTEELGYEFAYLQSLLLRGEKDAKAAHLQALTHCKDLFIRRKDKSGDKAGELGQNQGIKTYLDTFQNLLNSNPDFTMVLATDFFTHMEATSSISSYIPSTNSLLQGGGFKGQMNLLQQDAATAAAGGGAAGNGGMGMTLVGEAVLEGSGPGSPTKGGGSGSNSDNLTAGVEITRAVQMGLDLLQTVSGN